MNRTELEGSVKKYILIDIFIHLRIRFFSSERTSSSTQANASDLVNVFIPKYIIAYEAKPTKRESHVELIIVNTHNGNTADITAISQIPI